MKFSYYPKLALDSIRKNRQLYYPFILTCIVMIAVFYILSALQQSEALTELPGNGTITIILSIGLWVMLFFTTIFLFYTNSFLIRRRKKEFGLYAVLGMGRANILAVLFFEVLFIAAVSLALGLTTGILLFKAAELGLDHLLEIPVNYDYGINLSSALFTVISFSAIFLLLYLNVLFQVRLSTISNLLLSEQAGERPPKGNWVLGLLGILFLGVGYYISLTTSDPISAIGLFFVAVIFVIAGTYLLLISGSVLFCRLLQKNKGYYYKTNHFISVSSLAYRMKRNGAGLASICILSTMVLVMLSTTFCLYRGAEQSLNQRYPRQINLSLDFSSTYDLSGENTDRIDGVVKDLARKNGVEIKNTMRYTEILTTGFFDGARIVSASAADAPTVDDYYDLIFTSQSDYNRLSGEDLSLGPDQVLLLTRSKSLPESGSFEILGKTVEIVSKKNGQTLFGEASARMLTPVIVVVDDLTSFPYPEQYVYYHYYDDFDTNLSPSDQMAFSDTLNRYFDETVDRAGLGITYSYVESREQNRVDFYALYGGLLYLGLILSVVFTFATVLIIYYKQICEGFEDKPRFSIMQKVGLTDTEIKKSVNSQLLTVFFVPLLFAVINLIFAFPIIDKLLVLFNNDNSVTFAWSMVICVLVFSLFYTIVYKITSGTYYKIVS